ALQRAVGVSLLDQLPDDMAPTRWLDLGSGTGHFSRVLGERFAQATGVAVDIAEGMLCHARGEPAGARYYVAGDAER
ncbi:methyltransferase domain-containing protein, partial [Mycobacterium tuberculosis]|nr:methyltransferase domain-containing protein [Mycobacterium tuberculosis]